MINNHSCSVFLGSKEGKVRVGISCENAGTQRHRPALITNYNGKSPFIVSLKSYLIGTESMTVT